MAEQETKAKESRYDELVDTAARIFAVHGFKSTTIQDIAREMNITGAAVYYYIKSKDDLLYEIWRRAGQKLQNSVDNILRQDVLPEEKVRLFFRSHLKLIIREKPIFEVLILERSRLPSKGKDTLEHDERRYLETLTEIIKSLPTDKVAIAEPKILAFGILAMLNGVIRWYSPDDRLSLDEIADLYFDAFMRGILRH
jgi:TetR/AcrR family transcriptional regulator, cholesterol catabolism regulator